MKISKRLEVATMMKILKFLDFIGPQRRTPLSLSLKMSYTRLIPILNTLELFKLVTIRGDKVKRVGITVRGKCILLNLKS